MSPILLKDKELYSLNNNNKYINNQMNNINNQMNNIINPINNINNPINNFNNPINNNLQPQNIPQKISLDNLTETYTTHFAQNNEAVKNQKEENKNKEWGNINIDPFGNAKVVETKVQLEKNEEDNTSSMLNPFYSHNKNPFDNNLNNSINENKEINQETNNVKFEDIKNPLENLVETNTIIPEQPKEVKNEKKEENKNKEWENINMDPLASAKVVETVVQSEEKLKNSDESRNSNKNPFYTGKKNPFAKLLFAKFILP